MEMRKKKKKKKKKSSGENKVNIFLAPIHKNTYVILKQKNW